MLGVREKEEFGAPDVSWMDGSWFDSAEKRFNPQYSRIYGQGVSEERGGPGVVTHTTSSALRNGH